MTPQDYKNLALMTAPRAEHIEITQQQARLLLGGLGAAGEAGEIADIIKKHVFHGHPLDWVKLRKEMGDTIWYLNYLASLDDADLSDVMRLNIEKLAARYPEGYFSTDRSLNRIEEEPGYGPGV